MVAVGFVQPPRLLRSDLFAILSLRLRSPRLPVLEGAEVGIGKLPVVLGAGDARDEPQARAEDDSRHSLH